MSVRVTDDRLVANPALRIRDQQSSARYLTAAGVLVLVGLGIEPAGADAETRLLRFPAIHGDKVAFTYAGDIWTATGAGGTATRITAHPGMEVFARFSPDGKWIAFTGQYDGDEQVYVVMSFGLNLSDEQFVAIVAAVNAVLVLVAAIRDPKVPFGNRG